MNRMACIFVSDFQECLSAAVTLTPERMFRMEVENVLTTMRSQNKLFRSWPGLTDSKRSVIWKSKRRNLKGQSIWNYLDRDVRCGCASSNENIRLLLVCGNLNRVTPYLSNFRFCWEHHLLTSDNQIATKVSLTFLWEKWCTWMNTFWSISFPVANQANFSCQAVSHNGISRKCRLAFFAFPTLRTQRGSFS